MDLCPLCTNPDTSLLFDEGTRPYLKCPVCDLTFVPPRYHPSPAAEKRRYDQHNNNPQDPDYRRFLSLLADPLAARVPAAAEGLDFGCGPTGALSILLAERGYRMTGYDPFYAPDSAPLERQYDFLACAEAIEHFFRPAREWAQFLKLVKPDGWIGIMTGILDPEVEFSRWWYRNDITHVSFFSRRTFTWLAERDQLDLEFSGKTVALFRRKAAAPC